MIKDRKRLLASPHYDNLSGWNKPSIVLVPRKLPASSADLSAPLADSTTSSSSAGSRLSPDTSETSISRISEALDGPRVLLALSLAADANVPDLEGWIQWLTNGAPPEIRNLRVKYESIYHGHSTLLLVSMPVTAWTRLPSSSGFRFVDVVTSDNLIPQAMADKGKADTVVNQHDNAKSTEAGLMKSPTGVQTQMLEKDVDISVAETFGSKSPSRIKGIFDAFKGLSGWLQTAAFGPAGEKISANDSALRVASSNGDYAEVQRLLDRRVDVDAERGSLGSALDAASSEGHDKVVQILLKYGANIEAKGGLYGNALQAASFHGHDKMVQILLEHGADINARGRLYGTALQTASSLGHEKMVQILLEHGADINARGGLDGTALQMASSQGHEKVVQILLEHGAEINDQERYALQTQ